MIKNISFEDNEWLCNARRLMIGHVIYLSFNIFLHSTITRVNCVLSNLTKLSQFLIKTLLFFLFLSSLKILKETLISDIGGIVMGFTELFK